MSEAAFRALCIAGIAALAAAKIWAGMTGDLAATLAKAGDDPWGLAALASLYLGMFAFAVALIRIEPDRRIAIGVLALTPLVGNMALAGWLAWRGLGLIRARTPLR